MGIGCCCSKEARSRLTLLGEVAPKLLYLLDTWRRKSYDCSLSSTLSLLSAQETALIQPHFVLQLRTEATLIFLEDTRLTRFR